MSNVTILHLDQQTLWGILQLCFTAPIPSRFKCGSLKPAEIKTKASSFQANCRRVFMRVKVLATPCRFFRTSAWEGFIDLVQLLSANTTWTYFDGAKEPTEACCGTAAVHIASVKWESLMDGVWDWLQEVVQFYKTQETDALLKEKDALLKEKDEMIKKKDLMLEEKDEEIKRLKRSLELALEQLPASKRQCVAD